MRTSSHQLRLGVEARPGVALANDRVFVWGDLGLGYAAWPTTVDVAGRRSSFRAHGVSVGLGAGATVNVWRNLFVGGRTGLGLRWFGGGNVIDGAHDVGIEGFVGWRFGGHGQPPREQPPREQPPRDPSPEENPDPDNGQLWSGDFKRDPVVGCFQAPSAKNKPVTMDFLLGVYHAPFGREAVRQKEAAALGKVFAWMKGQKTDERDLFIVGDFNLNHKKLEKQLATFRPKPGMVQSPVVPVSGKKVDRDRSGGGSTLSSHGTAITANLYDQFIVYDPAASEEVESVHIIDARKDISGEPTEVKKQRRYYKIVSDHLLIQAILEAEKDDD